MPLFEPSYTRNHIDERIDYVRDKFDPRYGSSFLRTKQHDLRDQNRFVYKLRADLSSDSMGVLTLDGGSLRTGSLYSHWSRR